MLDVRCFPPPSKRAREPSISQTVHTSPSNQIRPPTRTSSAELDTAILPYFLDSGVATERLLQWHGEDLMPEEGEQRRPSHPRVHAKGLSCLRDGLVDVATLDQLAISRFVGPSTEVWQLKTPADSDLDRDA